MMQLRAEHALIGSDILDNVRISIAPDGSIATVAPDDGTPAERVPGLLVPGIANLHSHAFQRAMAGLAERASPEGDDFWQWREVMYRFLSVLTPDDAEAIAAQLYIECLKHGYTAIAEFHYLHNQPDGTPYANPAEMTERIAAAAETAGIGLTLLPVLYRQGGFNAAPPSPGQRRFLLTPDLYATVLDRAAQLAPAGVAPHSLRAVTPDDLSWAVRLAGDRPIHIHVAEQEKEVADCLAATGAQPVDWLLDHQPVGARWCLIHATHMTEAETARLAATGAVAGLCPTTEANLGDGIFRFPTWLRAGGAFGVGGDSHVGTSPAEELRWLEYVHRLQIHRRNATTVPAGRSIGADLFARAVAGGAQALGRRTGRIAPGWLADLVALDLDHPALAGRPRDAWIDAWLFAGNSTPVRDVMVAGRWVIRDGHHPLEQPVVDRYRRAIRSHS